MTRTSKLDIAMICHPSIGGSGILATELGHELALLGHRVTFICHEAPFRLIKHHPNIDFESINPVEFPLFEHPDLTLPLINRIAILQEERSFDLIHAHYAIPNAAAAVLARSMNPLHRTRILTTLHGTDVILLGEKPEYHHLIEHTLNHSDAISCVSDNLMDITSRQFELTQPVSRIHNFYRERTPTRSRSQVREELGIGEVPLAIHASNLRNIKRIDLLLENFAQAAKTCPDLHLLVVAGASFEPYRSLVKQLDIADRVRVREQVQDVQDYLEAADFGVYTSEYESFCLGILESMAHGLPAVAFDVGGIHEVMLSGETGYLVPFGDHRAMIDRIIELCDSPEKRRQMGKAARERAAARFNHYSIVEQYLDLYDRILDSETVFT